MTDTYELWRDVAVIFVIAWVWIIAYVLAERRRSRRDEQQRLNIRFERRQAYDRQVRRGTWKLNDRRGG
jgi:hypothetical protein